MNEQSTREFHPRKDEMVKLLEENAKADLLDLDEYIRKKIKNSGLTDWHKGLEYKTPRIELRSNKPKQPCYDPKEKRIHMNIAKLLETDLKLPESYEGFYSDAIFMILAHEYFHSLQVQFLAPSYSFMDQKDYMEDSADYFVGIALRLLLKKRGLSGDQINTLINWFAEYSGIDGKTRMFIDYELDPEKLEQLDIPEKISGRFFMSVLPFETRSLDGHGTKTRRHKLISGGFLKNDMDKIFEWRKYKDNMFYFKLEDLAVFLRDYEGRFDLPSS